MLKPMTILACPSLAVQPHLDLMHRCRRYQILEYDALSRCGVPIGLVAVPILVIGTIVVTCLAVVCALCWLGFSALAAIF